MLCQAMHRVTKLTALSEGALGRSTSLSTWSIWLQDFSAGVEGGSAPWRREKEEEVYLPSSLLSLISCW